MYDKLVLQNGVRIVSERMPHVRSAAVGIWIGVGSRNEKASENGAAHFIEHMLFKGTDKHSAAELASIMDGIGGQINAFTTRESTCFYARVLDTHLDTAISLLCDMFFQSKFDLSDVQNERGVILEDIDMYDDTPEDLVVERLFRRVFPGALGRPVLGNAKSLAAMTGETLQEFKNSLYSAPSIVISLCGSYSDEHIRAIEAAFGGMQDRPRHIVSAGKYTPATLTKRKATEQNHLCIAFPALKSDDPKRYAMQLMLNILGGGMSSRLFQTVREQHGLCYSIYTFSALFRDTGLLGIATALGRDTEMKALSLISGEIRRICDSGVTEDELYRAREQVKSNLVISMESTSSRMQKLGSGELILGRSLSPDDLIAKYDAVSGADVLNMARSMFRFDEMSLSAVGRVSPGEDYIRQMTD